MADAPQFEPASFPESERRFISDVAWLLYSFNLYADDFRDALSLFDFCASQMREAAKAANAEAIKHLAAWKRLAAHAGVVAASNALETMIGVTTALWKCDSIKGKVSGDALEASKEAFKQGFPSIKALRHRVAHPPTTGGQDSFSGNYWGVQLSNSHVARNLNGRMYETCVDREIQKCEISQRSLEMLCRARDEFFSAFKQSGVAR